MGDASSHTPSPRDFILPPGLHPGLLTLRYMASSRRSCQIATVHFNTETLRNRRDYSQGSPCLCVYTLGLLSMTPTLRFMASSRRSCQIATVLFNTETLMNRRAFSQGTPCLCVYNLGLHSMTPTLRSWRLPDAFRHRLFPAKRKTVGKKLIISNTSQTCNPEKHNSLPSHSLQNCR